MPETESLFRASVVDELAAVRVAAVRVPETLEPPRDVREVVVRGVPVVVVDVPSRRAAVVELALERGRRSAAVLPGLDMMELVLLDAVEVVDFFSSSLALTLGRLLWLEAEVAEVAVERRTVPGAPGRAGGLLKPPGARVLVAVLAVLEVVVPGRRAVVVPAGRFT